LSGISDGSLLKENPTDESEITAPMTPWEYEFMIAGPPSLPPQMAGISLIRRNMVLHPEPEILKKQT